MTLLHRHRRSWVLMPMSVLLVALVLSLTSRLPAEEEKKHPYPPPIELPAEVTVLSPIEAYGFIKLNPGVNLIDLREKWEWKGRGVIEGASSMGYLQQTFREHFKLAVLREKEPILLYCALGTRAKRAAQVIVNELGYKDVYVIEGGLRAWQRAGLPVKDID